MARSPNLKNRAAISKLAAARTNSPVKASRAIAGQAPKKIAKPAKPDDLTKISGVGPALQKKVNIMGVWTYRQIAEWKGLEVAYVNSHLNFSGRIERDQWIRQAKQLMRNQVKAETVAKKAAEKAKLDKAKAAKLAKEKAAKAKASKAKTVSKSSVAKPKVKAKITSRSKAAVKPKAATKSKAVVKPAVSKAQTKTTAAKSKLSTVRKATTRKAKSTASRSLPKVSAAKRSPLSPQPVLWQVQPKFQPLPKKTPAVCRFQIRMWRLKLLK